MSSVYSSLVLRPRRSDTHTGVRLWQAAKAFIITAALLGEAREVGEGGGRAENEGVELYNMVITG